MNQEQTSILRMVAEGKISPDEAEQLLDALEIGSQQRTTSSRSVEPAEPRSQGKGSRWRSFERPVVEVMNADDERSGVRPQPTPRPQRPPTYGPGQNHCPECHVSYGTEEDHCAECHQTYAASENHCPECHHTYSPSGNHCPECHQSYGPEKDHCLECHQTYGPEQEHCPECHVNYPTGTTHSH